MSAIRVPVRQGSREWLDFRRTVVTGTDIPVLLGVSPYKCEADLADEKAGAEQPPASVRMRMGSALETLNLAEYEALTGCRTQRFRGMVGHPSISWAAASPDARRVGERVLVELKFTTSKSRFADGVPDDVAAQVQWQLGCMGYPIADVSVLTPDGLLDPMPVAFDAALFADLVAVADDFRRRLLAGGPFARDAARVRRDHPADDGSEIAADNDTAEAVRALLGVRDSIARLERDEAALKAAIEARMGPASVLTGDGFRVTWRKTKDQSITDWKALGTELLQAMAETDRTAAVGKFTTVRAGFRPLRVVREGDEA